MAAGAHNLKELSAALRCRKQPALERIAFGWWHLRARRPIGKIVRIAFDILYKLHHKPRVLDPFAPLAYRVRANVAWVAPALERIDEYIELGIVGRHLIVEQKETAGSKHACRLPHESARIGK